MVQLPQALNLGTGQFPGRDGWFGTEVIKTGQTFLVDGLTHGFAALAAEMLLCSVQVQRDRRITVRWLSAMETIQGGHPWALPFASMVIGEEEGKIGRASCRERV